MNKLLLITLCLALPLFGRENDVGPSAALRPFVQDGTIAGAVTLVVGKEGVRSLEACGKRNLAAGDTMPENAMFWIASMTKPMTALAAMMLVEAGKLNLSDEVALHLPEFKGQMLIEERSPSTLRLKRPTRAVTVKDLLTHTSGLVGKSPLEGEALDTLTLRESVLTYALSPLQFEPGSQWQYCNPGINTLGRIIETVSGKPYEDFMQERLFTPLGMKDTTFWPTSEQLSRMATSYQPGPTQGTLEPTTVKYLSPVLHDKKRAPMPAGGLFSCAADLAKLYQMLLNGGSLGERRYIGAETLAEMTRNQLGDMAKVSFAPGMQMGLGFHIVHEPTGVTETLSPGSYGHGGAYGTQAWMDPTRSLAFVLLIQRAGLPNSDQSEMRRQFQKAAVQAFAK